MTARRAEEFASYASLPPGTPEDKALALAFKAGEQGADQAIYDRYSKRVRNLCLRMLGNPDDAAEAAQETFLRVYQGLARFNGRYQLGPWVTRIASNVCLDMLRARSRRPVDSTPLETLDLEASGPADRTNPESLFMKGAEGATIHGVLDRLPARHRAALLLRDYDGHSYADIATSMGLSESQVKALLHRARGGFRKTWTSLASAFLPLRNLVLRARDVVDPTVEQAARSAVQSAPLLAPLTERLGAAAIAVVVVSGVGATVAVQITRPAQAEAPVAQAPGEAGDLLEAIVPVKPAVARRTQRNEPGSKQSAKNRKSDEGTAPAEAPAPSPEPSPEPAPTSEPSPEPAPSESPAPAASPSWSMNFSAQTPSEQTCSCSGSSQLVDSEVSGSPANRLRFYQRAIGPGTDAEGDAAWGVGIEYYGEIAGSGGSATVKWALTSDQGSYRYRSTLNLAERYAIPNGTAFRFSGSYELYQQSGPTEGAPTGGHIEVLLLVGDEGALYGASFSLQ